MVNFYNFKLLLDFAFKYFNIFDVCSPKNISVKFFNIISFILFCRIFKSSNVYALFK